MLRSVAEGLGYRLTRISEQRKPATDWAPAFDALSTARATLGLGPAVNTGSDRQRKILQGHTPDEWIEAIEGQRESLAESKHLTDRQRSTYMSLETVGRNFDRCLQSARATPKPATYQLSNGQWVEEVGGQRRPLTPDEILSRGLA